MKRKFHTNQSHRIEGSEINAKIIRMSENSLTEQVHNEKKNKYRKLFTNSIYDRKSYRDIECAE